MPIDALLSLAHTMVSATGTQALLLGSGVSRSAQVPTGWDVTLDLVRRVAVLAGAQAGADPAQWFQDAYGEGAGLLGADRVAWPRRPPNAAPSFKATSSRRRRNGKQASRRPRRRIGPSPASSPAASSASSSPPTSTGCSRPRCATRASSPSSSRARTRLDGAAPVTHQRCLVVKLHGDYLDDRIKNTEAELAAYDPRMDAYLDRILDEFGLVVCGWSGDWDPALRSALERCKSRRYTTTWVAVGKPSTRASRLIALRGAQLVTATGADAFFGSLAEKVVSLADLGTMPPASVATAVASLKRYVAEDKHRVRLDDLIMEEASRLAGQLAADFPFQGGASPTLEMAAARVRRMDAATEILRNLFFHGCRLAAIGQEPVFQRALALLASPENVSGYKFWADMARYPMASIVYAGAFGALVAGNYRLLRKLLVFSYRVNGHQRIACDRLAAASVLPTEAAKALFTPQRSHTPTSDHLADVVGSLATGLHPDPQLLFDELEIWVALAHLDVVRDLKSPPLWMPPGRFGWRGQWHNGHQPGLLLAEATAAGSDWPPIAAGWFGGKMERWNEVSAAFTEVHQRMASSMW